MKGKSLPCLRVLCQFQSKFIERKEGKGVVERKGGKGGSRGRGRAESQNQFPLITWSTFKRLKQYKFEWLRI